MACKRELSVTDAKALGSDAARTSRSNLICSNTCSVAANSCCSTTMHILIGPEWILEILQSNTNLLHCCQSNISVQGHCLRDTRLYQTWVPHLHIGESCNFELKWSHQHQIVDSWLYLYNMAVLSAQILHYVSMQWCVETILHSDNIRARAHHTIEQGECQWVIETYRDTRARRAHVFQMSSSTLNRLSIRSMSTSTAWTRIKRE